MKYIYGQKVTSFRKKLTSLIASMAILANSMGVALPIFLNTQRVAAAPNGNIIIRPSATVDWGTGESGSGGTTKFVADSNAPYGSGALELATTGADASRAQRSKAISPNLNLSTLNSLSYSTRFISGPAHAGASLQITISNLTGAPSGNTTLVYEPYWNGTIDTTGAWQTWDTVSGGKFWSTKTVAGFTNGKGGPPFYTIAEVLAAHPNAKITSLKLNVGTYNQNWIVRADGIKVNGNVYDFEQNLPTPVLNAENFNTVDDNFKGMSVGFNTKDFGTVSAVSVEIKRADGTTVTKTGNQGVFDIISNQSSIQQLSTPFVIQEGVFTEASDTFYWNPAPAAIWNASTTPVQATITVTDQNGPKTVVNTNFSQGNPSWPTYESLLPPTNTSQSVVVNPTNLNGWEFNGDRTGNESWTRGNGSFVTGPSTPPLGTGSAQITTDAASDREKIRLLLDAGTKVSDLKEIKYSTYRDSSSAGNATALALQFDVDFSSTPVSPTRADARIVYEPYLTHTILDNTWQTWNTQDNSGNGNWWIAGANVTSCTMSDPCTWSELLSAFPSLQISNKSLENADSKAAVMFKAGGGWATFSGSIDQFVLGIKTGTNIHTTTYDFEPAANTPPTVNFELPTPAEGSTVSGTITPHVLATDDYGMGSYYIRLWKGSFESGAPNLVYNNCWSAPGAFNLGSTQDVTCPNIDTTTLEDGTYVLSAQFLDGQGVWGQALRTFTVLNTPPSVPGNLRYEGPVVACGGSTNINWTTAAWDSVASATSYDYEALYNGTVVYTNNFTNTSNTGSFGGGQNGTWAFRVRSVGPTGLKSNWTTTCDITLDTVAPDSPVHLSPGNNSLQNVNDFYFDWTSVSDAVEYEFQSSQTATTDGSGALTTGVWNNKAHGGSDRNFLTDSTIHSYGADGTWYWQVRTIDAAGNKSAWTSPWKMTIDIAAPSTPTILNPTAEQAFNTTPILNKWTSSSDASGVAGYQVAYRYDDGHSFGGSTCPGETIEGLAVSGCRDTTTTQRDHLPGIIEQGGVTIWVRAIDAAGNKSAWSTSVHYYYDATAPAAPTITMSDSDGDVIISGFTNSYAVITTWPAVDGATGYQYRYFNSIPDDSYNAPNYYDVLGASTSVPGVFNRGEGLHHVQVRAYDAAGNWSGWSNTVNVVYDATNPVVTSDLVENQVLSGTVTLNETLNDTNPDRCKLRIFLPDNSAMPYASTEIPYPGCTFTVNTTSIADGNYVAKFTGWDKAGNAVVLNVPFSIDNTPPALTINPLSANTNTTPIITGTVDDPTASVKVSVNGGASANAVVTGTTWSYTVPGPLAVGVHSIVASASDIHGNTTNPEPSTTYEVTLGVVESAQTDTPSSGPETSNSNSGTTPPASQTNISARSRTSNNSTTTDTSEVLAAETGDTEQKESNTNRDLSETDQGQTLAATDEKTESAQGCGKFMSICWYWWIPIVVAILGTFYYLVARRQNQE